MILDLQVEWEDNAITVTRDSRTRLRGVDVDCADIPDAAMTLAVIALFAEGEREASWICSNAIILAGLLFLIRVLYI